MALQPGPCPLQTWADNPSELLWHMVSNSLVDACQEIFPQINPQNSSWGTCEGEPCQTLIDAWQTLAIDLQSLYY